MKKMMLLAVMVAIAALMMAATPAFANDNNNDNFCDRFDCHDNNNDNFCDRFDCHDNNNDNRFFDHFNRNDFCDLFDCNRNNSRFDHNNRNVFVPEITQDLEQEAESGDVNQSFNVTGGGDNSNQCVGLQGVANTGNAQNQIGVTQVGQDGGFNDFDHNRNFFHNDGFNSFDGSSGDFSVEDSGASIEMNPVNTTSCGDQQVNQAATASG
jgi:hypothetical protein